MIEFTLDQLIMEIRHVDEGMHEFRGVIDLGDRWRPLEPLLCPECGSLFKQTTLRGSPPLYRATCPEGHSWDVYL